MPTSASRICGACCLIGRPPSWTRPSHAGAQTDEQGRNLRESRSSTTTRISRSHTPEPGWPAGRTAGTMVFAVVSEVTQKVLPRPSPRWQRPSCRGLDHPRTSASQAQSAFSIALSCLNRSKHAGETPAQCPAHVRHADAGRDRGRARLHGHAARSPCELDRVREQVPEHPLRRAASPASEIGSCGLVHSKRFRWPPLRSKRIDGRIEGPKPDRSPKIQIERPAMMRERSSSDSTRRA